MKRSKHALGNSGSKTVARQAATWSSGFKPSPKSRRVKGNCEVCALTVPIFRSSCHNRLQVTQLAAIKERRHSPQSNVAGDLLGLTTTLFFNFVIPNPRSLIHQ